MDLRGRVYGEYKCSSCGKKRKSINASEEYQDCRSCGDEAERIMSRPLRYSVNLVPITIFLLLNNYVLIFIAHALQHYQDIPEGRRLFGKFRCPNCNKTWQSGNAWKGYKQQCKDCKVDADPYFLNFLEFQGGSGDLEKPHLQDLCEKCEELGYNCRNESDHDLAERMSRFHI